MKTQLKDVYVRKDAELRVVIDIGFDRLITLLGLTTDELDELTNGSVFSTIKLLNDWEER